MPSTSAAEIAATIVGELVRSPTTPSRTGVLDAKAEEPKTAFLSSFLRSVDAAADSASEHLTFAKMKNGCA